jgi:hypothetical protein
MFFIYGVEKIDVLSSIVSGLLCLLFDLTPSLPIRIGTGSLPKERGA